MFMMVMVIMVMVMMIIFLAFFEFVFDFQVVASLSKNTAAHFNLNSRMIDVELLNQDFINLVLTDIRVMARATNMGGSTNFA